MKLKGPLARLFGFSDRDFSLRWTGEVSAPFKPNVMPTQPCYAADVAFEHQTHVNLCTDACLNMLFEYRNRSQYKSNLDKNPRSTFSGQSTDAVKERIEEAGLIAFSLRPKGSAKKWTGLELAENLFLFGPIICMGSGHAILLIGVSNAETLIFHDPWRGQYMPHSLDHFNKKIVNWDNLFSLVAAYPFVKRS
jgi:hypothetical protein